MFNRERVNLKIINSKDNQYEANYLDLVARIVNNGELRCIRGNNVYTLFGEQLHTYIENVDGSNNDFYFPLLTHRKVFCKNMIEEILWILRGDIDISILQSKGVTIWNGNASEEFLRNRNLLNKIRPGFIGPMYGYQIRNFNAPFEYIDENLVIKNRKDKIGFDQFEALINKIKNNKFTRTLVMTTFNPAQVDYGCLYPCTGLIIQFYIDNENKLHQIMYQRSCDLLIGFPHNMCVYALLNYIIAKLTNLKSGSIKCFLGDVHVYEEHLAIFDQYFNNKEIKLYKHSKIYCPDIIDINDINNLKYEDFHCYEYFSSDIKVKYHMFVGNNYKQ